MSGKVVVGMSGGVDSAVSALLLQQQGYEVTGLFMQNWADDDGYCTAAEDFQSARAVADELGIALHKVDFSARYSEQVFAQFLAAFRAGRTPNPDVLCNREIKFSPFTDYARRLGAQFIATGHYAALDHRTQPPTLRCAADANKDQTYFLCMVPGAAFSDVLFPLGELPKSSVRAQALAAGLPNHQRKDSTGICFIGERNFREFLAQHLADAQGAIVDERSRKLGEHPGLHHFTLGQRKGLAIGGRADASEAPWYVIGKNFERNELVVAQDARHPRMMCQALRTEACNWISGTAPKPGPVQVRIRHRQALQGAQLELHEDGIELRFEQAQRAAVCGQIAALYRDGVCLGGGEICRVQNLEGNYV